MCKTSNKRRFLSFKEKNNILKKIEKGRPKNDIAKMYGISISCLYKMLQNKKNIIMLSNKNEFKIKKCKRSSKDVMLEECLLTWFLQTKAAGKSVSGPILQEKALQLNNLLKGPSNYKASNGWLERFKNRHGIQLPIKGKILFNNSEAAQIFCDKIVKKIRAENLLLENVYNADESGIYWKSFPKITLAEKISLKKKLASERKDCKDRVTALFCCNATGTNKIKLCIIGKSAQPRSIKNMENLPVVYKAQNKGWMNRDLFQEWYQDDFIPAVLEHQRKNNIHGKVLLLLDNAPSHLSINVLNNINENFEVKYLPPNVTALIQPINQGAISITKKLYKKQFLMKLILQGKQLNINEFLKNFTLRDCIILISNAWENVQSSTLNKIWKPMLGDLIHADKNSKIEENNEFNDLYNCILQLLHHKNDAAKINKWIAKEERDEGWAYLTDAEIIETVKNNNKKSEIIETVKNNNKKSEIIETVKNNNQEITEVEDNNCLKKINNYQPKEVSHTQAYQSLQVIKDWCEKQNDCKKIDIFIINKLLRNAATKASNKSL